MEVYNHDVAGLHARINRFIVEIQKSVSSNVSQMNGFDISRALAYLGAIDTYHAWVVGQPALDLPETAPRTYTLEENPAYVDAENESINDLQRMFAVMRDELVNSQSARLPAGLVSFDSARLAAVVAKARAFLIEYVQVATPLDLPESSPMEASTGAGLTGI